MNLKFIFTFIFPSFFSVFLWNEMYDVGFQDLIIILIYYLFVKINGTGRNEYNIVMNLLKKSNDKIFNHFIL